MKNMTKILKKKWDEIFFNKNNEMDSSIERKNKIGKSMQKIVSTNN